MTRREITLAPRIGHLYLFFHAGSEKPFERVIFYEHYIAREHKIKINADFVYVLPSDYGVCHEIIDIETGEYREFHI